MRVAGTAARTKDFGLGGPAARESADRAETPDPADLLAWYDRNRRRLPWRALPGEAPPDPYRVWLSEIMLQQTTVKTVGPYYARFLARWPSVVSLAEAPLEEVLKTWAGLGYYARARNLHACARALVERYGGRFPDEQEALQTLPGVGAYTSAAIAAIAFDRPVVPVDGNVERVVTRLFAVRQPMPGAKPTIQQLAQSLRPTSRAGDFAQALMDLGATICSPTKPACALCPWFRPCTARALGEQEIFPVKAAKEKGKLRRGAAFVVVRADGAVLVQTRPPKGLLGGMTQVPTSEWRPDFDPNEALSAAPLLSTPRNNNKTRWDRIPGVVTHVFTHFPLELTVYRTELAAAMRPPPDSRWVPIGELAGEALPTVMRKVLTHALGAGASGPREPADRPPRPSADAPA
jgi:A/G-specific adenine glycosylase